MFIHAPCENHNGFKSCAITHIKQKSDRWHVGRTLISASHLICVIHVTYMNKTDYGPSYHHMEITRLNKCSLCFRQPWEGGDLLGQRDSEMEMKVSELSMGKQANHDFLCFRDFEICLL